MISFLTFYSTARRLLTMLQALQGHWLVCWRNTALLWLRLELARQNAAIARSTNAATALSSRHTAKLLSGSANIDLVGSQRKSSTNIGCPHRHPWPKCYRCSHHDTADISAAATATANTTENIVGVRSGVIGTSSPLPITHARSIGSIHAALQQLYAVTWHATPIDVAKLHRCVRWPQRGAGLER